MHAQPVPQIQTAPAGAAAVAERVLSAAVGTLDILVIALGVRLGYYQLLAQRQPLTPPGLAAASGTALRYAREWLEQQAVTGLAWPAAIRWSAWTATSPTPPRSSWPGATSPRPAWAAGSGFTSST
jgi:hypothetical protein